MLGQVVGRYRIVEQIGAGGMGIVYRAVDEHLSRDVAVKVLPPGRPSDANARRRFRDEAYALSRLNHPNIALVFDFDTFGDIDALVMELVPGVMLSDHLRSKRLTPPEILDIAKQMAAGLSAAHDHGVVHGDLKPSNMRLTPDGHLKILDFGLARMFEGGADQSTRSLDEGPLGAGTLPYMAPEQLDGEPASPQSDIYAAGATMYELATGEPLFSGPTPAVIDRIRRQVPESPRKKLPHISAGLEAIILKAIDKRPDRRYQNARELLVDLQRCDEEDRVAVATRSGSARPTAVSRRLVMIALLLTAVAAAWWQFSGTPPVQAFPNRGWAVIADFDNRTADPHLGQTLRESLQLALQQSDYVNVLSREQVFDALRRMERADATHVDEDLALAVARREGAHVLIVGSAAQGGGQIRVTVRALTPDGGLLFAESVELSGPGALFARIDELARRVRLHLGESLGRIQQASQPLDHVTTRSYDALRLYTQAVDAFARGDGEVAPPLLQACLTLDPGFAMAHHLLARVFQRLGNRMGELQQHALAFERRMDTTLRERYLIEAGYFGAHERYDDVVDSLAQLVALYPNDPDARVELASARLAIGDMAGAIQEARENLRIRPDAMRARQQLALSLAKNGEEGEALAVTTGAPPGGSVAPGLRWAAAMALLGLGRIDEAREQLATLEAADGLYQGIGSLYLARADLFEGQFTAAAARLVRDRDADAREGRTTAALLRRYLLARLHLLEGRRNEARFEAQQIASAISDAKASDLLQAAMVFVELGDLAAARRLRQRLVDLAEQMPSSFTRSCVHQVSGEMALVQGRGDSAHEAFASARAEYGSQLALSGLARSAQQLGRWQEAADAWSAVIASRGEVWRDGFPPDLVRAHLELVQIYAGRQQWADAARHHDIARALWDGSEASPLLVPATVALGPRVEPNRNP